MNHQINVRKFVYKLSLLVLMVTITNCSGTRSPIATSQTSLVTPTLLVTKTETPTPAATVRPSRLTTDCLHVSDESLNQGQFNGTLVLSEIDGPISLLNLETGEKVSLPDAYPANVVVSPDRSKLAYDEVHGDVIVSDKYGNNLKNIPDPQQRLLPAQWLDNARLVISESRTEKGKPRVLDSLIVMNLSTGEKQEILPDYPDINYFFPPAFQWEGYYLSRIVPDPTLHYLVYPAFGAKLVLWDVLHSREVRHVYVVDELGTPWWSPDGTRFITSAPMKFPDTDNTYFNIDDGLPYKGGNDLITVNQVGETQRLTYLTTEYKAKEFHYTWSPDGQQVAFWMQLDNSDDSQLAVVDVSTGKIRNYCISTTDGGTSTVWSPDGSQLAISPSNSETSTVIVDLKHQTAIKVADKAVVLGWMR